MISKKDSHCGVADYGRRVYDILKKRLDITLAEIESKEDYNGYVISLNPSVIIYNYHHATLSWLNDDTMMRGPYKHYAIFHEGPLNFTPDKVLNTDIRPLFNYNLPVWRNAEPTIGSFGFGFPDKNYIRIAEEVAAQYDKAKLRLNIPFAYYGDRDGYLARREADKVRGILKGTNIEVEINHYYLTHLELLHFLNYNDLNLFLYSPSNGRGLASATDFALSVNKPIGVSNSEMFRHLPPEICIDNTPLKELTVEMLAETKEKNSNEKLVEYYKRELCL